MHAARACFLLLFFIIGCTSRPAKNNRKPFVFSKGDSVKMAVSKKNIVAYPATCAEMDCSACGSEDCLLCSQCMDREMEVQLTNAYREYIDRHDCKRVFPPKFVSEIFNR